MSEVITLNMNTPSVQYLCKKDKRLAKVISMVGEITYSLHKDENAYCFLVHEIIEQMLSIKAGQKIFGRLEELCNGSITPDSISKLSDEEIRSTGTSNAKVTYIRSLTNAVVYKDIDFSELKELSDTEIIKQLTSICGIGNWTAKMYLIFVLDHQDVLPFEDSAFLQSYRWIYKTKDCSAKSVLDKCKKWKPYSSIAARYLYRALDMGFTKEEFHLYK
ncbi:DNA-3-methyladenine glycosylase family protein [Bacillus licheniformis]|uniref:DNA-3-methyladenine glycosylase family protein n=1 Tax=Bacillus licheniformis TaxID=1402 RepID=UPI000BA5F774|nr:DNA-3-methyladenine glycosylase [Bacillus licheniformis]MBK4210367.1 DNA-3-methyladenine glycosylase 2 family protein [Bacillus licheniformis]MEC1865263.1 DNA-3-methyladenine glycosylase [Bacillus licheniformis]PAE62771.1 DNA repair protein [Bacillus licheniformis]TWM49189.1 hypothetical protein CHCC14816_0147 [Bacillus licheniformis]